MMFVFRVVFLSFPVELQLPIIECVVVIVVERKFCTFDEVRVYVVTRS